MRPDVPMVLFGMLVWLALFKFLDSHKQRWLVTSALALSVSFMFLQKAVFSVMIVGTILLATMIAKRIRLQDLLLCGSLAALPLLMWAGYMAYEGTLEQFCLVNYRIYLNMKGLFSAWGQVTFLAVNWLLWGGYAIGLVMVARRCSIHQCWLALATVGLLLSIYWVNAPFKQYYMPALPLVAVVAGHALQQRLGTRPWAMAVVMVVALAWPVYRIIGELQGSSDEQLRKIQYVIDYTEPSDYVYDGDIRFNLFRRDLDFFWFIVGPQGHWIPISL